jgi:hypothetical protein
MKTKATRLVARVAFSLLLCGIMVFESIQALGEEGTEAQKGVWSAIENNWDKYKQGDLDAIEASMHLKTMSYQLSAMSFYRPAIRNRKTLNQSQLFSELSQFQRLSTNQHRIIGKKAGASALMLPFL